MPQCGLYAITPEEKDAGRLLAQVEAVLRGGAVLVQFRDKSSDDAERSRRAGQLQQLCSGFAVPLLINDDVELAIKVSAAGVHLGRDDGDLIRARARLGEDAIIGASCYSDLGLAARAAEAGVDYLAFGAFQPSTSKPGAQPLDHAVLAEATRFGLPRVAIGGINADNAPAAIAAGANLIAVIGALFDCPDPEPEARRLAALFDTVPNPRVQP